MGVDKTADIIDLPVAKFSGQGSIHAKGKNCVDLILDWKGTIDMQELKRLAETGYYDRMPAPVGPKTVPEGVGYHMQVVIHQAGENKWDIVKHFTFTEPVKKPSRSTRPARRTKKLICEVDESFLNKRKPGKLSKLGRPKKDQIWIWGAVVQGRPDLFMFRVLDHPMDAWNGKTAWAEGNAPQH